MPNSVLYVCLGNSCRSIMAEALTRHLFPDSVTAGSAGLSPLGYVSAETLQVLAELGVATEGLRSKGLAELNLPQFNLLVNLTAHPFDAQVPRIFSGRVIHYPVADPFGESLQVYREARDAIRGFVAEELPRYLGQD
jgi:arsenate reductase (thioredoxin)